MFFFTNTAHKSYVILYWDIEYLLNKDLEKVIYPLSTKEILYLLKKQIETEKFMQNVEKGVSFMMWRLAKEKAYGKCKVTLMQI